MRKYFYLPLFIFYLCTPGHVLTQPLDIKFYEYPVTIPQQYIFNAYEAFQNLSKQDHKGVSEKDYLLYCESLSYNKSDIFNSGNVYLDWKELEDYLNTLGRKLFPKDKSGVDKLIIYSFRDPAFNAYALHDGSLFVNIGLFADVKNEAALAAIIAHEIAHYLQNDVQNSFISKLELYSKRNINKNAVMKLDKLHENRVQERIADSLGFVYMRSAGFEIKSAHDNFILFYEQEKEAEEKMGSTKIVNVTQTENSDENPTQEEHLKVLYSTHPAAKERIQFLEDFQKKHPQESSQKELKVDLKLFHTLQKKARLETLYILLTRHRYLACLKKAFTYHLFEPENAHYIYFILESLRRMIYLNEKVAAKGFLSQEFDLQFKKGEGILKNLNYLLWSKEKIAAIKAHDLIDTHHIAFNTYGEAFNYFSKYVLQYKIKESVLTLGLYHHANLQKRDSLLEKYISFSGVRYRNFASNLMKNNNSTNLSGTRELVLLNDISFLEYHYYGFHNRRILGAQKNVIYVDALQQFMHKKYVNKELIYLPRLASENLRKSKYLEQTFYASTLLAIQKESEKQSEKEANTTIYFDQKPQEAKTQKVNIFILDPSLWSFFKENNLRSLELIEASAFDDKTEIANTIQLLNPFKWLFFMFNPYSSGFFSRIAYGSHRYQFKLNFFSFTPTNQDFDYYVRSRKVGYKMTKPLFLNEVYSNFQNAKNENNP